MADKYVPQEIEPRWSAQWERAGANRSVVDPKRPKHYALTMLPYPSGDLHIGHWYAMTPSDARARWMRMRGFNVLFPMGFDAFGLPAENAAIQRGIHPKVWTYRNIDNMRRQLRTMGAMFDWEREAVSSDPEYYRWSQWFFLQFYQHDLAYRQKAAVDFCPNCNTTLAREQVWGEDRHCERCGTPVIKKELEQWFFRTTRYADALLDHATIDWPERVETMQKNWIGRSEGAHVTFMTEQGDPIRVFTTRPDTLWGATFMVLAPEHPLVEKITTEPQRAEVETYIEAAAHKTEIDRTAEGKAKTGVFTGGYAINPVNDERIPIWVADYVLISYGSGAIMAVPAHDQRDFEFARQYGLPIRIVIQPDGVNDLNPDRMTEAWPGEGVMVNSGAFDGTSARASADGTKNEAVGVVTRWLEQQGIGHGAVNYRLRDWLISRQRYWGAPIPIVYCAECGTVPVPEEDLPVLLPEDVDFKPTGESPLRYDEEFLHTTCPQCGGPATRETDTMDTFMCSSWYQYRYLSPRYNQGPFDPQEGAYWLPVDQYTGGIEHATMHLMYTRFFTKAMRDCGIFAPTEAAARALGRDTAHLFDEPMLALFNQGMILGEPRDGDLIIAAGSFEGGKLNAVHIAVVPSLDGFQPAPGVDTVAGEVLSRKELVLNVQTPDGRSVVVDTDDSTIFEVPGVGEGATIEHIRYQLDVEKMSKSKGNVVAPDELVAAFGADAVRAYLMFAFRWEQGGPWDSQGIQGVVRWLNDIWALAQDSAENEPGDPAAERALRRKVHQTIKAVEDGLEHFAFNTAVAALMALRNTLEDVRRQGRVSRAVWGEAIRDLLLLMAPFTPFISEELWHRAGRGGSVHAQPWPVYDSTIAAEDEITLVVQVNGKVRDRIQVPASIGEEDAKRLALASAAVQRHLDGQSPRKVIYIGARGMVSIVV
ncbi:MAG: leucine--tRNA ligase [Anaerolineae bacterium]|nr:leucine--tRNA ligase [Anaerolineae bacterium]